VGDVVIRNMMMNGKRWASSFGPTPVEDRGIPENNRATVGRMRRLGNDE
jgi:hypothetical protein